MGRERGRAVPRGRDLKRTGSSAECAAGAWARQAGGMTFFHPSPRLRGGGIPVADIFAFVPAPLRPVIGAMPQLLRYAAASGAALVLDFGVFLKLNAVVAAPTLAGVAGYACGIVMHFFLSRHFVFSDADSQKCAHRLFGEFVASGLIGLAVTAGVIALGVSVLGLSPLAGKALAAIASFFAVFVIRRKV